jgi:hypothetical protein
MNYTGELVTAVRRAHESEEENRRLRRERQRLPGDRCFRGRKLTTTGQAGRAARQAPCARTP